MTDQDYCCCIKPELDPAYSICLKCHGQRRVIPHIQYGKIGVRLPPLQGPWLSQTNPPMSKQEPQHVNDAYEGSKNLGCIAYAIMFILALVAFAIMLLIDKP